MPYARDAALSRSHLTGEARLLHKIETETCTEVLTEMCKAANDRGDLTEDLKVAARYRRTRLLKGPK